MYTFSYILFIVVAKIQVGPIYNYQLSLTDPRD